MFRKTLIAFLAAFVVHGQASAQSCSGNAADNLLACSHIAIESCRTDNLCTEDRRQSLSVQDIVESAAARCCPLQARRERVCLNRLGSQLARARALGPTSMRSFLAEARAAVLDLKNNGCDTGTLGDL